VDRDSQRQREALRRGLRRANLASVLILVLLVALAFGFVWKARQSTQEAERASVEAHRANAEATRARQASARAEDELWNARLNEMRARRIAGGPGARIESAATLRQLVQRPGLSQDQLLALRQEAIAQLALVDVAPDTNWVWRGDALRWDGSLTRYARHRSSGEVDVYEHLSGRVLMSFRGPSNAPPRVSLFTPDGRLLATRFSGSDVLVWDLKSQKLLLKSRCRPVPGMLHPLESSPDSRALLMFTEKGLVVQPLNTNSTARPLQPGRVVLGAVFTRDSRRLAIALAGEPLMVEVWDVATGATLERFDVGFPIRTFEWHPDGRRLAVSGDHGRLGLWEINPTMAADSAAGRSAASTNAPRETLRLEGHVGAVNYTMFTPDGSCLLTHSYDKMSIVWGVTSGHRLLAETRVRLQDFSETGEKVRGIASDDARDSICAFLPRTGFRTFAWDGELRPNNGIWLSPDSRLLVVAHPATFANPRGECRLWDFQRGVEIARFPGIWAQFSRDSRALYTFGVEVVRKHELHPELLSGTEDWPKGEVLVKMDPGEFANAGTISMDGRTLVVGAVNRVILVDVEHQRVLRRLNQRAHNGQLSPDGALLGTRFHNERGCLRNPTTGAVLTQMVGVVEFVFSPDNKWILAKGVEKLRLLDSKSLAVVREIPLELGAGFPPSTVFSPDGTTLALSHNRFDVRLLDLATGRERATLSAPHPAQVDWSQGLAFSSDSRWLLAAKQNGEVVGWDLPVIRAELSKLGLDWNDDMLTRFDSRGSEKAEPSLTAASLDAADDKRVQTMPSQPAGGRAATVAFGAVALALTAGLFVSLHQRRTLSAYVRAETLAMEQQGKLRAAQEELLQSQKMRALGTLAAGIAHDFNNLLSVIRLSNQLAAEQTKASGVARENMDAVESAVSQGENIVQSMLGYSRAAAELDDEYAVAAAVSETVSMLGRKFLAGIVLKLDVAPHLPPVRGSRGRFEQMLLNLIVNASEAMSGQGTLRLSARVVAHPERCTLAPRHATRYVEVSVGDSGPGIPSEVVPRVFEPFFTTKQAGVRPGTGLGLSTVYTMAQQDGLGLGLETQEGKGTVFRILVPVGAINPVQLPDAPP
jgi:signal transduction histidine kinase